jgi:hypothetical protein
MVLDPLTELNNLKQQFTSLLQMNQFLAQQVQQLHAQQPAAPQSASLPRIRQPNVFKGEMGFVVDDWISELEQQFAYYKERFVDESSKVKFALAFLAGPAVHWWEHEPASKEDQLPSWDAFKVRLHGRFRPVQASLIARQRLDKVRQRPNQSVNQFASLVQTIMTPITDMSEADQVHKFVNGLLSSIQAKVWERHPKTLKDAIDYAVSAEAMGNYGRAAMSSSFGYNRSGQAPAVASSSAPMDISNLNTEDSEDPKEEVPAVDPMSALLTKMEAMEHRLNAMFKPGPKNSAGGAAGKKTRVAGLTPDELADCRARGLCFRCKKSGHFKNDPQCKALNH